MQSHTYRFKLAAPAAALSLTLTTLLAVAGGCAFFRETIGLGAQKPRVQVASIEVSRVTLDAIDLLVSVRVDNPNDFELRFEKLKYSLAAAELPLAAGEYGGAVAVPATGTAYVKLPLTVDAKSATKLAERLLSSPEDIKALVRATADFDSPVGALTVDFEDSRPLSKIVGN
jgi:LEA14-like dessication related protein